MQRFSWSMQNTCFFAGIIIICYVLLGTTPSESKQNFLTWLDLIVTSCAGPGSVVCKRDKSRQPGCYHMMKQDQHSYVEAKLSYFVDWAVECTTSNLSAGTFFSIEVAGVAGAGQCRFIQKKWGIFLS